MAKITNIVKIWKIDKNIKKYIYVCCVCVCMCACVYFTILTNNYNFS